MAYLGWGITAERPHLTSDGRCEMPVRVNVRHPGFWKLAWVAMGDMLPWYQKVKVIARVAWRGNR